MPTENACYSLNRIKTALSIVLTILICSIQMEQARGQARGGQVKGQNRAGEGKKTLRGIDKKKSSLRKQSRAAVDKQLQAAPAVIDPDREPAPIDTTSGRLQANPPRPERICYEALDRPTGQHNAILYVRYANDDRRLGAVIHLSPEGNPIVLRDDGRGFDETAGDGSYAGLADLDLEGLAEWREMIDDAAAEGVEVMRFSGRSLAGSEPVNGAEGPGVLDRQARRAAPDEDLSIAAADDICRAANVSSLPPVLLPPPPVLDPEKTLIIRDLGVVEDPARTFDPCSGIGTPGGKWTFRYAMEQMANQQETGISAAEFTRRWLKQWEFDLSINFHLLPARTDIIQRVIDPWELNSGGPGQPLDLDEAPFKLVAIVNRVDLRENLSYGSGSAGEARLVFGVTDRSGGGCIMMPFAVIFEYGIQKDNCLDLQQWAAQWYDLNNLVLGSPAYNAALEDITEQFVAAGADPAKLPNKSALNQIRTNENALDPTWELREFRIQGPGHYDSGHLRSVAVAMTPELSFNQTSTLADFINQNETAILSGTYDVPLSLPSGSPFLGAGAPTPFGMIWDGDPGCSSVSDPEARHLFSLTTCNGCHAGETGTMFLHIDPVQSPAGLSGFLTGTTVLDPCTNLPRIFADLDRRSIDLENLVNSPTFPPCLSFMPLRQPH
mgnify:FL=1